MSKLARVGNANWDLYVDSAGRFSAVARPGSGASDSTFGSRNHVLKLMRDYPDHDYVTGWTEAGREALSGAFSRWFRPVSNQQAIDATIQENGALLLTADDESRQELQELLDGRFWFYPDYMVTNCLQLLADDGQVTFKLASASQETPDNSGLAPAELDAFFHGFVEAMLWSTSGDEDEDLLDYDLAPETRQALRALCETWTRQHEALLRQYTAKRQAEATAGKIDTFSGAVNLFSYAGHDFWLTSAGHGVGFWCRGMGALGDLLTTACEPLAHKMEAYVGDSELVYVTGMESGKPLALGASTL